jgi:hypothetical protein
MSAPDPIRRLREIAAASADHAILADGPVTPDAPLLDLCAEALHLLSQAEKAQKTLPSYGSSGWGSQTQAERLRIHAEIDELRKRAKPVMYRIRKIPLRPERGSMQRRWWSEVQSPARRSLPGHWQPTSSSAGSYVRACGR